MYSESVQSVLGRDGIPEWLPRKSPNVSVTCGGMPHFFDSVPYSSWAKAADRSHFKNLRIKGK